MRWRGWLAFASITLVACYSGLSGLAPFPCAKDGTCPSGFFCDGTTEECVDTCPTGFLGCAGACVDTSSSTSNCGQCGNACMTGAACIGGTCSCGKLTSCSGACTDTTSDASNCGGCGRSCGGTCSGGKCVNDCTLLGSDCGSGKLCALEGLSSTLWATSCRASGSAALGEPCQHGNDCAAGLECLFENNVGWCWQLCDNAHPCPGGATCHGNTNIPNGGGYCTTASVCGASNDTVHCSGPSGTYTCPANSFCNPTTSQPTECTCNTGFMAYSCMNQSCASTTCNGTTWWCD